MMSACCLSLNETSDLKSAAVSRLQYMHWQLKQYCNTSVLPPDLPDSRSFRDHRFVERVLFYLFIDHRLKLAERDKERGVERGREKE